MKSDWGCKFCAGIHIYMLVKADAERGLLTEAWLWFALDGCPFELQSDSGPGPTSYIKPRLCLNMYMIYNIVPQPTGLCCCTLLHAVACFFVEMKVGPCCAFMGRYVGVVGSRWVGRVGVKWLLGRLHWGSRGRGSREDYFRETSTCAYRSTPNYSLDNIAVCSVSSKYIWLVLYLHQIAAFYLSNQIFNFLQT